LVLAAVFFVFRPESPDSADSATASASAGAVVDAGEDGIGSAPRSGGTGAPPHGTRAATGTPTTPVSTSVASVSPSRSPVVPAPLSASYREPGILGGMYAVTVANKGQTDVTGWTVSLKLTGVGVKVDPGKGVTHEARGDGTQHVFTPMAALETVPARGSVSFTFTVQGVLPSIENCLIDDEPCTTGA
jgi:hypothetical protein